jgi:iron complex transport system substrate-binding protein
LKTLQDQIGTSHTFETTLKRIVSLVPSQTELLYDMGLEESIVGITKFCVHPFHFKSTKKIIGGTKKVHFEKISLLLPDIIIANKEENTIEIVEELSKICPVWVTDIITLEDNLKMIEDFGQLFNKSTEAQNWIDKINFAYHDFQVFIKEMPIKKAAYFIWANPYMVAGRNTFINEMLKLNRFENIYEGKESRYPEIELNNIHFDCTPDLVLLSSEPFPFCDKDAIEIARFIPHAKVVLVDGEMFSWYGSRILKAFEYFKLMHSKLNI